MKIFKLILFPALFATMPEESDCWGGIVGHIVPTLLGPFADVLGGILGTKSQNDDRVDQLYQMIMMQQLQQAQNIPFYQQQGPGPMYYPNMYQHPHQPTPYQGPQPTPYQGPQPTPYQGPQPTPYQGPQPRQPTPYQGPRMPPSFYPGGRVLIPLPNEEKLMLEANSEIMDTDDPMEDILSEGETIRTSEDFMTTLKEEGNKLESPVGNQEFQYSLSAKHLAYLSFLHEQGVPVPKDPRAAYLFCLILEKYNWTPEKYLAEKNRTWTM